MPFPLFISPHFPGIKLPYAKNFEANRYVSFKNWNHPDIFASSLAKAGFWYPGRGTEVECCFCNLKIYDWLPGQLPLEVHKEYSPHCSLFSDTVSSGHVAPNIHIPPKKNSNNRALAELVFSHFKQTGKTSCVGVQESGRERNQDESVNPHFPLLGAFPGVNLRFGENRRASDTGSIPKAADGSFPFTASYKDTAEEEIYPQFSTPSCRTHTFLNFPLGSGHTLVKQLSHHGFFYTGHKDIVICYFCGLGLRQWLAGDDPKIAHARWSPRCRHLHNVVTSAFIMAIQREMSNVGRGQ